MEAHTVQQWLHLPTGVWLLLSLACPLNNGVHACMKQVKQKVRESKCECQKMMHAIIVPCIRRMNFIQDLLIMPTTKPPLSNDFVAS